MHVQSCCFADLNLFLFAVLVDVAVVVKLPINENGKKKTIGSDRQNKNFARTSRSFVHYFAVIAQRRRETA